MIGRRTAVGLSLLCALLFSAIAVQSASAVPAINTTAFTCVKGGGDLDFEDAHCDKKGIILEEEYGHKPIPVDETTEITATNETTGGATTPAVLTGKLFGQAMEINCTKVSSEGWIENKLDTTGSKHTVTGEVDTLFTGCTVIKPAKCTVKEPIEVADAHFEGVEELGLGKDTMGVQFKPTVGTTFATITLEGAECALKGTKFEVKGSAIATGTPNPKEEHSGVTTVFTNEMTKETLEIGGVAADFSSTTTVRRKGGDPISLTTTT